MKEIVEQLRRILNEDLGEGNVLCDELFIRELLADEENAIRKYKDFAARSADPETTKLFLDIAKEEEVHSGELRYYIERMLNKHGRTSIDSTVKGTTEVEKLLNECFLTHADLEKVTHEQIYDMLRDVISKRNHRIVELENYYREEEHSKNVAYHERDMLVAVLSKQFPSYLAKHDPNDKDWDAEWCNIVYIDMPTGQCSWHIKDNELPLFSHLEYGENNWDGHTTVEKYIRLSKFRMGINRAEHPLEKYLDP